MNTDFYRHNRNFTFHMIGAFGVTALLSEDGRTPEIRVLCIRVDPCPSVVKKLCSMMRFRQNKPDMQKMIEVLFSPAEFSALKHRDLSRSMCVVFDILRATTSMMTALGNGAKAIIPVTEISEALAIHKTQPVLLAGERDGLRIRAAQTGGTDFDLGNSPREFTQEKVRGKTIAMTTTNGTRALQSCAKAKTVLIGSFLNLNALADRIVAENPEDLILICAGTFEQAAFEDTLAAGVLCELLAEKKFRATFLDSAEIARQTAQQAGEKLLDALQFSRNARRLLSIPDLRDDVAFCVQRDTLEFVAGMEDGLIKICSERN